MITVNMRKLSLPRKAKLSGKWMKRPSAGLLLLEQGHPEDYFVHNLCL